MKNTQQGEQTKASTPAREPQVGICWLIGGKLVIDSTGLSNAESYGAFKVYPGDHCSVWENLQRVHVVPADAEYEEFPRGRVMYDTKTRRFRLLADRCILKDRGVVTKIIASMNLPRKHMDIGADDHYRCFDCLHGRTNDVV
jgi:hypothetical protein